MKYIKEYNQFEELNEKVSVKDIVLYFAILYGINGVNNLVFDLIRNYNLNKEVNKIYSIVNSPINLLEDENKILIEKLKKDIILQVKNSNLFDKFGKNYILDSLENITIKIANPTGKLINENTAAVFIKLGDIEKMMKNKFLFKFSDNHSTKSNVIIINERYINDKQLPEMLTHEIYHYVDALLSSNNNYISSELKLSKFVDKNLDDKNYSVRKLTSILSSKPDNIQIQDIISKLTSSILEDDKYLSSDEEIFTRWKTLKTKMIKNGYIEDMKTKINKNILLDYLSRNKPNYIDIEILLILDFDKIEELDNAVM